MSSSKIQKGKKPDKSDYKDFVSYLEPTGDLDKVKAILTYLENDPSTSKKFLDQKDHNGHTAMIKASIHGHLDILKRLIKLKAHCKIGDTNGLSPLTWAIRSDQLECVKELLNYYDINKSDHDKTQTKPLHWACWADRYKIVKHLIDNGADIHAKEGDGLTPLHMSSRVVNGDFKTIELLCKAGANVNYQEPRGNTIPIHVLLIQYMQPHNENIINHNFTNFSKIIMKLIDSGSDIIKLKDNNGFSTIIYLESTNFIKNLEKDNIGRHTRLMNKLKEVIKEETGEDNIDKFIGQEFIKATGEDVMKQKEQQLAREAASKLVAIRNEGKEDNSEELSEKVSNKLLENMIDEVLKKTIDYEQEKVDKKNNLPPSENTLGVHSLFSKNTGFKGTEEIWGGDPPESKDTPESQDPPDKEEVPPSKKPSAITKSVGNFFKKMTGRKDKNEGKVEMDSRQGNMMGNLGQVKAKKTYAEEDKIDKDGNKIVGNKVGMNVEGNIFSNLVARNTIFFTPIVTGALNSLVGLNNVPLVGTFVGVFLLAPTFYLMSDAKKDLELLMADAFEISVGYLKILTFVGDSLDKVKLLMDDVRKKKEKGEKVNEDVYKVLQDTEMKMIDILYDVKITEKANDLLKFLYAFNPVYTNKPILQKFMGLFNRVATFFNSGLYNRKIGNLLNGLNGLMTVTMSKFNFLIMRLQLYDDENIYNDGNSQEVFNIGSFFVQKEEPKKDESKEPKEKITSINELLKSIFEIKTLGDKKKHSETSFAQMYDTIQGKKDINDPQAKEEMIKNKMDILTDEKKGTEEQMKSIVEGMRKRNGIEGDVSIEEIQEHTKKVLINNDKERGVVVEEIHKETDKEKGKKGGNLKKKTKKKQNRKKWSKKYKKSINCNDPKGFSQKQYCKYGRKKNTRKSK